MPAQHWLEGYAVVGTLVRPWGVKGEVKVESEGNGPAKHFALGRFHLGDPEAGTVSPLPVPPILRQHGKEFLLHPPKCNTPEEADLYRGHLLLVAQSDLPPLPEGEYYFSDLAGLTAIDRDGTPIGRVVDVTEQPSVNTFQIALDAAPSKTIFAPWIDACIGEIDLVHRTVVVDREFIAALLDRPVGEASP